MRTEIARLHKRLGKTMIYVTHDQVEAMTMADRIVVLQGGDVIQVDAPLDIYRHPKNDFVATFIGSPAMNMLAGTVRKNGGDGFAVKLAGGDQVIDIDTDTGRRFAVSDGDDVKLGIRPEDIALHGDEGAAGSSVSVEVDLMEPMGNEVIVHGRIGGDADAQVISRGRIEPLPRIGDSLSAVIDVSRLNVFDAVSGNSLVAG